jgi:predicted RNase H-like HicB family nuclease
LFNKIISAEEVMENLKEAVQLIIEANRDLVGFGGQA